MSVAQTAKRRRKQMKLDKRYGGWRKSAAARDRRLAMQRERERAMTIRKGQKKSK
jgi:hypothetical protein